jgi:hypothetical protein
MDGAMVQGILLDEAIEVLFKFTGHFAWSTGARAIHEPRRALVGKAVDPFTQGRIGKVQRVGDRLEALSLDDVAHSLGTAEETGFFRLFQESI